MRIPPRYQKLRNLDRNRRQLLKESLARGIILSMVRKRGTGAESVRSLGAGQKNMMQGKASLLSVDLCLNCHSLALLSYFPGGRCDAAGQRSAGRSSCATSCGKQDHYRRPSLAFNYYSPALQKCVRFRSWCWVTRPLWLFSHQTTGEPLPHHRGLRTRYTVW